jgi:hypothetical protein
MTTKKQLHQLFGAFGSVQEEEDGDGYGGVDGGSEEFVGPEELEAGVAYEAAVDEEDEDAVEEGEAEVHYEAGAEALDVDLYAYAGGGVGDDGFGDAVDAQGLGGEGVLEEADGGSSEGSGDGGAAGDGEEDGDDEGEIEDGEAGEGLGQEGLQEDRGQGHEQGHRRMEVVLFEFAARCIAAGRHGWARYKVLGARLLVVGC